LSLTTIDATCPLVTKVHAQARRYAEAGYAVVLIGHAGHEEVEGTLGEAPEAIVLVQSAEDAERVSLPGEQPLAYITQTTLSVDETGEIVAVLRRRFPRIEGPAREDICYATSNRQWAVKELVDAVDLLLVVGSTNSSNSQRLVEVARAEGTPAHLVDDVGGIDARWLEGCETVGLTSGASAPERLVADVCAWFTARGAEVCEQAPVHEDVSFKLPVELRRAERAAA
jgi:4-hydroxy-3-methylbut-2-enyl diphosphate reductase